MKKIAIIIILIGLVLSIFTAVTFYTEEKFIDIGELEIKTNMPHKLNWSPYVGLAVMAVGGILFWQSSKK